MDDRELDERLTQLALGQQEIMKMLHDENYAPEFLKGVKPAIAEEDEEAENGRRTGRREPED